MKTLEDILEPVALQLPPGWKIRIAIDNKGSLVTLVTPNGEEYVQNEELPTILEQVIGALDAAIQVDAA